MRLHRYLPLACAIAVGPTAMLAGCTFLIDFEEAPAASDAGLDARSATLPDVRVDSNVVVDAALDAGADVRDAIADPDACRAKADGKYCPGNQITWPGSKDDLITCKAQVVSVRFCATGNGCIRMANGLPDQCDECAMKPLPGTYCGKDFGWEPKNAERLVTCQNGAVVDISAAACVNGCNSNGAASACK